MPACALPFSLYAAPLSTAMSVERAVVIVAIQDRRRRIARRHRCPASRRSSRSVADSRHRIASGHLRDARKRSETSANVPSPRLRYSRLVSVGSPLGPQLTGTPFHRQFGSAARFGGGGEIEAQIVCDEQIELPVAVVVDERAARSPSCSRGREPGRRVTSSNRPSRDSGRARSGRSR